MVSLAGLGHRDKQEFYDVLIASMEERLELLLKSAEAAKGGATHGDAVAKSKYDTHGLELSYLAGSQFARAEALSGEILQLKKSEKKLYQEGVPIVEGALVELQSAASRVVLFLSVIGAGSDLSWRGAKVSVISPSSPMGVEIIGLDVGDEFTLQQGREFEIVALL